LNYTFDGENFLVKEEYDVLVKPKKEDKASTLALDVSFDYDKENLIVGSDLFLSFSIINNDVEPASNIILATLLSILAKTTGSSILTLISAPFIIMNINLAIFNLLPVPPLDGSKILYGLLPMNWAEEYNDFMRSYGQILLILLILPIGGSSLAINLILPVIQLLTNLLL
jgi:hypothetical protein